MNTACKGTMVGRHDITKYLENKDEMCKGAFLVHYYQSSVMLCNKEKMSRPE